MAKKIGKLSETTDAINQSGSFLQTHVMHQLDRVFAWSVDSEFPVQVAPFVDDPDVLIKRKLSASGQQHPEPIAVIQSLFDCQNKTELEETSIDVVGGTDTKAESFRLCIECKKLDPDYVDWVFFNANHPTRMNLITKNTQSVGFANLLHIPETTLYHNEIFVQLNKFQHWDPFKHPISNSSIAISNKKISKETYQTKKSLIDNASRQIIKGTYGYIQSELQHQILSGEGYDGKTRVYVPIVVTTANLKVCEIDPKNIDPSTGFVKIEPTYKKVDAVIYECPPPKSVRFPSPEFTKLSIEHRRAVIRWHVLVLSPKGLVNFLQKLHDTGLVW